MFSDKITVFGDSIPKGYTTINDKIERIENSAVDIIEKHYGISIDNRSFYGQTLDKLYKRGVVDRYIDELNPNESNAAAFCIGGNDSDYDWKEVAASPDDYHDPKTPLNVFSEELDELVKKLKYAGVKVYMTTLPPVDSERYFNTVISKIAEGDKVMRFFKGDVTNINRHQECYNYEIIKTANVNGCKIIDIRSRLLMDIGYLSGYSLDGVHPNEVGHRILADEIIRMIDGGEFD